MSDARHDGRQSTRAAGEVAASTPAAGKTTRTMQLRAAVPRPTGGPAPTVDVAGAGGGQPLAESARSNMEHAFGVDLSTVRVHEGEHVDAAGAVAYAAGEDVHFRPGAYAPDTHAGLELIGHELAHVVQQREGRVAEPMGKGGVVTDAALEREADEMGARAARGEVVRTGTEVPAGAGTSVQHRVVQRKVGFEFETVDWTFRGRAQGAQVMTPIAHTKDVLIDDDAGGGASADNGHVEFKTGALTNADEVRASIQALRALAGRIRNHTVPAEQLLAAAQRAQREQVEVGAGGALRARPQATIGVTVTDIPELFGTFLALEGEQQAPPDAPRPVTEAVRAHHGDAASPAILLRGEITAAMNESLDEAPQIVAAAIARAGDAGVAVPNADDGGVVSEISAFLTIVLKTLWDAWRNAGQGLDDAKYAFPLMPRTDFRTMFLSLSDNARACAQALWGDGVNGVLAQELNGRYPLDAHVYSRLSPQQNEVGGFVHAHQRHYGPTKRAWLDSAVAGVGMRAQNKDLMSPPQPYPAHQGNANDEGLGAKGADTDGEPVPLMLFELRNLAAGGLVPEAQWEPLAVSVFNLVTRARAAGLGAVDPPQNDPPPGEGPDLDGGGPPDGQVEGPPPIVPVLADAIPPPVVHGAPLAHHAEVPVYETDEGGPGAIREVTLDPAGGRLWVRAGNAPGGVAVGTILVVRGARYRVTEIVERVMETTIRFQPV